MNKKMTWLASGAAVMLMGISMPSCPGQQAMQQQIDALQAKQTDLMRQLSQMDNRSKSMAEEFNQAKTLLAQVSNTVLAQRQAIEQMDASIKTLTARLTPPSK